MFEKIIESATNLLPEQGPIGVFVHHNTLHHFEDQKFEDATEFVAERLGAQPYMEHDDYVDFYLNRRISSDSLVKRILKNTNSGTLPKEIPNLGIPIDRFLKKLILTPKIVERSETIEHLLLSGNVLKKFAKQASDFSKEKIREEAIACHLLENHSEKLLFNSKLDEYALSKLWDALSNFSVERTAIPSSETSFKVIDDIVNKRIITFLNAYSDQGISYWKMPNISSSLIETFLNFVKYGERWCPSHARWVLDNDLGTIETDLDKTIQKLLENLNVPKSNWGDFIEEELLKLPGWTGSVAFFEKNPEVLANKRSFSIKELLVIRLLLLKKLNHYGGYFSTECHTQSSLDLSMSLRLELFLMFQSLGIGSKTIKKLSQSQVDKISMLLCEITDFKRRRILHQAYEDTYKFQVLDSIILNSKLSKKTILRTPKYQAMFCLDDREESLRRHLEETEPECETFGVAGFFGLNILFKGLQEDNAVPLCPVNVKAEHLIHETPSSSSVGNFILTDKRSRLMKNVLRRTYDQSRDFIGGAIFTIGGGLLSCVPMVFMIHFPRFTGFFVKRIKSHFFPEVDTIIEVSSSNSSPNESEDIKDGFTVEEMAEKVYGILISVGIRQYSEIIFIIGHGSSSLNNPHKSAYDCGACGGRRGDTNARVFAEIANKEDVRRLLREKGLVIPDSTYFIGGYHNTCSDQIDYFDTGKIPLNVKETASNAFSDFDKARKLDAHERCRRFEDANQYGPTLALKHVEGRSQNLREPRPEYGHCTNAMCIIGRRQLTKNLFLDRRAFLVSYDPLADDNASILSSVLSAVIPVCAGINLEYYYSFVDSDKFGCGTKLPHNITSLIGVMNGGLSDLKTGLPWQMVENHEPFRLITIVEGSKKQLRAALKKTPYVKKLVENRWIQLGGICPKTGQTWWVDGTKFESYDIQTKFLPEYSTSKSYYQGKINHLKPVSITNRG